MLKNTSKLCKIIGSSVSIGQPQMGVEKTPIILKEEQIEKIIDPSRTIWSEIVYQEPYTYEILRQSPIRNLRDLAKFNKTLYDKILSHSTPNDFVLNIGGDHSIGSATISALLKLHNENLAVVWVDAHGDYNTPITTVSGNYHGMPLAHVLGLFKEKVFFDWGQPYLPLNSVAMIGNRDLDVDEKILMDSTGLLYFTMEKIQNIGIEKALEEIFQKIDPFNQKMIHFSMDIDGLDPIIAPGTGTIAKDGLFIEDYTKIVNRIKKVGKRFVSMDLVEINFDIEKQITLNTVKEILKITFQ